MTSEEYRLILDKHNIDAAQAAKLFGIHPRTAQRFHYAETSIGPILARLVRLLDAGRITILDISAAAAKERRA